MHALVRTLVIYIRPLNVSKACNTSLLSVKGSGRQSEGKVKLYKCEGRKQQNHPKPEHPQSTPQIYSKTINNLQR